MDGESILQIEGLVKDFHTFRAVNNISLEVRKGEIFGFLGPNGAGKTTTMKACSGLLKPTAGRILIKGADIQKDPAQAKSRLGYVPDNPFLYEKLTGREFVRFMAGLYGVGGKELEESIENLFQVFEMKEKMDELIQGYSRGMRQKTTILAAIVHQPSLLMVDEPTANLDPRSARLVKDVFQSFKEQGRSVFLSTHIMEIAEKLCDRVAIIHRGEIRALGRVEDLRGMAGRGSLEEIFLELTRGQDEDTRNLLDSLSGG